MFSIVILIASRLFAMLLPVLLFFQFLQHQIQSLVYGFMLFHVVQVFYLPQLVISDLLDADASVSFALAGFIRLVCFCIFGLRVITLWP
jgi:hypothetical protein